MILNSVIRGTVHLFYHVFSSRIHAHARVSALSSLSSLEVRMHPFLLRALLYGLPCFVVWASA